MQHIQCPFIALWSVLAHALRSWARDIAQRKSLAGKASSGCLGLLVILCVCSLGLSAVRSAGETNGLLSTVRPTATAICTERSTVQPTMLDSTAFIQKPFSSPILARKVREVLDHERRCPGMYL
jgi:hypothetical protein